MFIALLFALSGCSAIQPSACIDDGVCSLNEKLIGTCNDCLPDFAVESNTFTGTYNSYDNSLDAFACVKNLNGEYTDKLQIGWAVSTQSTYQGAYDDTYANYDSPDLSGNFQINANKGNLMQNLNLQFANSQVQEQCYSHHFDNVGKSANYYVFLNVNSDGAVQEKNMSNNNGFLYVQGSAESYPQYLIESNIGNWQYLESSAEFNQQLFGNDTVSPIMADIYQADYSDDIDVEVVISAQPQDIVARVVNSINSISDNSTVIDGEYNASLQQLYYNIYTDNQLISSFWVSGSKIVVIKGDADSIFKAYLEQYPPDKSPNAVTEPPATTSTLSASATQGNANQSTVAASTVQSSSTTFIPSNPVNYSGNYPLCIGYELGTGGCTDGNAFSGMIDDVRVYNAALSDAEVSALATAQQNTRTANLVGWWKLDETLGSTVTDYSGFSNNGEVMGSDTCTGCIRWVPGKIDGALKFDGANIFVNVPYNPSLQSQLISFGGFFSTTDTTKSQRILSAVQGGGYGLVLNDPYGVCQSNTLCAIVRVGTKYYTAETPMSSLSANTWYHAFATYDDSTLRLYLNGNVVASTFIAASQGVTVPAATTAITYGPEFDGVAQAGSTYLLGVNASSSQVITQWRIHLSTNPSPKWTQVGSNRVTSASPYTYPASGTIQWITDVQLADGTVYSQSKDVVVN